MAGLQRAVLRPGPDFSPRDIGENCLKSPRCHFHAPPQDRCRDLIEEQGEGLACVTHASSRCCSGPDLLVLFRVLFSPPRHKPNAFLDKHV